MNLWLAHSLEMLRVPCAHKSNKVLQLQRRGISIGTYVLIEDNAKFVEPAGQQARIALDL